ncbi:MAG: DUF1570 domain-containing protein [Chromatiaceae bacterium]|nr:DUF1570 domain-containing protein [Chromatiaceae bacterium]
MIRPGLPIVLILALGCSLAARGEIYRWTDAGGRSQFGDRPPPESAMDVQALSDRYGEEKTPFSFEIIPVGYDMDPETRVKVEVAVSKIHEILGSRLGLKFRRDPSFTIRIFKDKESYAGYREGPPLAGLASGYYSPARNEAVTWRHHNFEKMLEVITHEANHALIHHRLGEVPPWLNEGLSEYFERMEVFGQAVVIHPNEQWDQVVKQKVRDGSIKPLRDYLGLSQQGWQIHNFRTNDAYAQAWSLIHFLMSTPDGTRLLGHLINTLDRVGAQAFSGAATLDADYEGGLDALETRWLAWVLGPKRSHYY